MKKETLALVLIIVCIIGSVIGLVNNFKKSSDLAKEAEKVESESPFKLIGNYDRIALITLSGVISEENSEKEYFFTSSPAKRARKYLDKAAEDNRVKGVVLRINSPGGTVGASQEVYDAVLRCRENKPIVVSMGDVAASGGYYISSAADLIVANPGTLTGSIGVIMNSMNFTDLLDKVGVKSNVIKSGKFKDIGSPFKKMTEADKKLLQGLIDNTYGQFVDDIVSARVKMLQRKAKANNTKPVLTEASLRKIADGRIFTGIQAKEVGLVDELGDLYKAKKLTVKLSQEKFKNIKDDITFEAYDKPQSLSEYIMEMSSIVKPKASVDIPFSASHPNLPLWVME